MDSKQAPIDQYPPPPPGPPPGQAAAHPRHPNETPIQDYNTPPYNPAHPQFAPPPQSEEGMYDEEPIAPQDTTAYPHPEGLMHENAPTRPGWGQRLSGMGAKAAAPLNKLAQKMGSETFLPTTMDKECEKAARILRGFCKDGIYSDTSNPAPPIEGDTKSDKPKPKSRTLLTIPSKVISRAVALAIFTTGRVGFHVSGATGSGILIARLPDGSWSPPSGIQVHSLGGGFVIGLDIYDCVVVINSHEALEAFTRTRVSLGSDLAVVAGPWGAGGSVDFAAPQGGKGKAAPATDATSQQQQAPPVKSTPGESTPPPLPERKPSPFRQAMSKPVYSYVKSRGFYAGVQVDGTVFTERKDANAAFFGTRVPVAQILRAEVPAGGWSVHTKAFYDVVRGAEGWRGQTTAPNLTTVPTLGVQQMGLGGGQQRPVSPAQAFKEAEAEGQGGTQRPVSMGPPQYTEQAVPGEEHPPAYMADGQVPPPPAPDSKTG